MTINLKPIKTHVEKIKHQLKAGKVDNVKYRILKESGNHGHKTHTLLFSCWHPISLRPFNEVHRYKHG